MALFVRKKSENYANLTDAEIVSGFKETRDNQYIGVLFDRYAHLVYGMAAKYFAKEDDRKEVVMQVFDKLFESLLHFEIANFKAWLYSVARNHCLMMLKSEQATVGEESLKKIQEEFMENEGDMYQYAITRDQTEDKLKEKIMLLNSEQRICIEWFYLQDKSYKEIAMLTGFDESKVKSYIQNGKRNLKLMLESVK
jgi:RNA polymerase sigma-70 factor (ECF subfamily)